MPVYATLIYTEDLDWSRPEQAETSEAVRRVRRGGRPTTSGVAPRCTRPPPPPRCVCRAAGAARSSRATAPTPRPRRCSAASTCSSAPTSTRPSPWPPRSRARGTAPSRCAPSSPCERPHVDASDPLAEVVRVEGGRILAVLARSLGDLRPRGGRRCRTPRCRPWRCGAGPAHRTTPPPGSTWRPDARPSTCCGVRPTGHGGSVTRWRWPTSSTRSSPPPSVVQDDLLRLLFTCCHPSLELDTRVALALRDAVRALDRRGRPRAAGGRERDEQAPDPGQAEDRGRPHPVPGARATTSCPSGWRGSRRSIHLVYTAGHAGLGRRSWCGPTCATRRSGSAACSSSCSPNRCWARGSSRCCCSPTPGGRPGSTAHGELVPLADQDRARWDGAMIAEGQRLLDAVARGHRRRGRPVPAPGGHLGLPRPGAELRGHGLAGDRAALRHPRRHPPQPDGRHQRGGRGRARRRPRAPASRRWTGWTAAARGHAWLAARGELLEQAGRGRGGPRRLRAGPPRSRRAAPSSATSRAAPPRRDLAATGGRRGR